MSDGIRIIHDLESNAKTRDESNLVLDIYLKCAKVAGFDDITFYDRPNDKCLNYEGERASLLIKSNRTKMNGVPIHKDKQVVYFDINGLDITSINCDGKFDLKDLNEVIIKIKSFLILLNNEGHKLKNK